MSTRITARASVAGLHHWPGAPERRGYLRNPHRHLFGIAVTVQVGHSDREVEWHDLAEQAAELFTTYGSPYYRTALLDFREQSCEQLANRLGMDLYELGYAVIEVAVDEDGEHTAMWRAE